MEWISGHIEEYSCDIIDDEDEDMDLDGMSIIGSMERRVDSILAHGLDRGHTREDGSRR